MIAVMSDRPRARLVYSTSSGSVCAVCGWPKSDCRCSATMSAGDVQAHVAATLARFKVPSRVFFIDDVLPRTATGKVLKRELKQRFGG